MAVGNYYTIDELQYVRVSHVISELTVPSSGLFKPGSSARDLGTQMHRDIERYLCGEIDRPFELKPQFLRFLNTHIDPVWRFHASEQLVFNTHARIAGTVDALFVNKTTGKFMIVDWKRTRGLYAESMLKYQLQLNLYRHIIGATRVDMLALVILHPDNTDFHFVEVPFMDVSFYMDNAINFI